MTDSENSVKQQENEQSVPLPTFGNDEIDQLVSKGLESYAVRNYEDATECLGQACGKYSEINGNEDPSLLFIYGRALFKVAMASSDVLGEDKVDKPEKTDDSGMFQFEGSEGPREEDVEEDGEQDGEQDGAKDGAKDEEEDGAKDGVKDGAKDDQEEEHDEQSDFEVAWEILDLARTLFVEKLNKMQNCSTANEFSIKDLRKKLAETYDLLGEVSLESENFPQACEDFSSSLSHKLELFPIESTLISEAHYKLSLAYEFNFEDKQSQAKSIEHLEKTIESVKLRIEKSGQDDPDLLTDLELRLKELQGDESDSSAVQQDKSNVLQGILGGDATTAKELILNAVAKASDINTLVRKAPKRKADSLSD